MANIRELTITEYAKEVNLTREAIHYQVKKKKLKSKKKKGIIYIILEEEKKEVPKDKELLNKIKFLEEKLKDKDILLEAKEMIIQSKTEQIQAEQRTNLALMDNLSNTKASRDELYLEYQNERAEKKELIKESIVKEIKIKNPNSDLKTREIKKINIDNLSNEEKKKIQDLNLIELNPILRETYPKEQDRRNIKRRFENRFNKEERIIKIKKVFWLNPKFKYEDLIY